jgi:hypothetical protein
MESQMKNAILTITREGHEVEVEVAPDNPGVGYVIEDTAQYDESGEHRVGMLYLEDESIPLTLLEEEEARERLEEANSPRGEDEDIPDEDDEIPSRREQDAAADAYFGNRSGK